MEIDNINFKQYKTTTFTKVQKKLIVCCFILSLLSLAVELGMYVTLVLIDQPVAYQVSYVLFKIVFPNAVKFIALYLAIRAYKSKSMSLEKKSFYSSLAVFMIASIVAIIHNYFSILLGAPAFSFFICSVFGEKKIIRTFGIMVFPVFILETITFLLDPECGPFVFRVLSLVCAACFIFVSYIYANILVTTAADQLQYIHKNYETQSKLIEELKIEPLTKLYNRAAFENTVARILNRFQEEKIDPYLVVIDIDFFKKVNDRYGHTTGDQVLIRLAQIIKTRMKGARQAFRYGGEEFVLIFEDSTKEYARQTVEQIRLDFEESSFPAVPELHVSLSAGISEYKKEFTGKDWFDEADGFLYQAKINGRNQVIM